MYRILLNWPRRIAPIACEGGDPLLRLCRRLLGRPASGPGTLCRGDGGREGGDRCRRSFVLPILPLPTDKSRPVARSTRSHKRRPRQAGGVVVALRGPLSLCDGGE